MFYSFNTHIATFSVNLCTRPRPILAAPTPEALPALANAGPMENDIEDMYYSPPAQSQDPVRQTVRFPNPHLCKALY